MDFETKTSFLKIMGGGVVKGITEKTPISLGLLGAFATGVYLFTILQGKTEANTLAINELKESQKSYLGDIQKVSNDLSLIKGKLGITNEFR